MINSPSPSICSINFISEEKNNLNLHSLFVRGWTIRNVASRITFNSVIRGAKFTFSISLFSSPCKKKSETKQNKSGERKKQTKNTNHQREQAGNDAKETWCPFLHSGNRHWLVRDHSLLTELRHHLIRVINEKVNTEKMRRTENDKFDSHHVEQHRRCLALN